jgi:integrase
MSKRKRWTGRIYLGRDENGKQRFHWVGRFGTRRERDQAVAEARVRLRQGVIEDAPTADVYVARFLAEYGRTRKLSSVQSQDERLRRFKRDFAGRRLDEVTRAEARDWVNGEGLWKSKGPVPASTVPAVTLLYNWAIDEDDLAIQRNPFRRLARHSRGRAEEPPPSDKEFAALLEACSVLGSYAQVMRSFLRFAAFTLMRPGEIYALEWPDIDFGAMRISKARRVRRGEIDTPKTGAKTIALVPPARDALLPLRRDRRYVFTGKAGNRLASSTMASYWSQVKARADLEFDLYHATKHYGVHYMWTKLDMSRRAIAAQAGWSVHTVDQMLAVYGHADVGALEEVDAAFRSADIVPLPRPKVVGD